MADIWSKQKRSEVMSQIRSSGNKETELRLIKIFREYNITGWRRKQKLFGNPDFTFKCGRVLVFVDGCFWHGCPKCYRRPKSNQNYWDLKIIRNRKRDRTVNRKLCLSGWLVIRFWSHQLNNPIRVANKVKNALISRNN